ncbi:MAG: nucleotidyl transferase AbiEii/AbiGii toxin family protein [Legionella sp.]|nr:nucleotidyl transferase AbiEii/AbiGii toxin family protein [Legionella sp.]
MIKPTPKNKDDFDVLVELAMKEEGYAHMRAVIEKELLHYDLLFALDKQGLLDQLTFQGGTSLRLCYGSARFSEDLDFAGGHDFTTSHLIDMKSCIETYIGGRYGLEVLVKEPREMSLEPKYQDIKVDKWQIAITTSPMRKDLPKQKIKIEVCNIPAYTTVPRALNINYDFLPDGYSDTLIMTESLDEIMADKLISLMNTTRYIRHRDIWDLRWLKQQGASINKKFIFSKIDDYKITDYPIKLNKMIKNISEIVHGESFYHELSRFIPLNVQERTLKKAKFKDFLVYETQLLLAELKKLFDGEAPKNEFYI